MTDEQRYKLEKALLLISDVISRDAENKLKSVWLSVAGGYCKDVADELVKKSDKTA